MESTAHLQAAYAEKLAALKELNNQTAIVQNVDEYQGYNKPTAKGNLSVELHGNSVSAVLESKVVDNAHYTGKDYEKQLNEQREAFAKSINLIMDKANYIYDKSSVISKDAKRILGNRGHAANWDNIFTYLNGVNSRTSNSEFRSDTRKDFPGDAKLWLSQAKVSANFFKNQDIVNVINMDCFAKEREKIVNRFNTIFKDPVVGQKAIEILGPAVSNIKGIDVGMAISSQIESSKAATAKAPVAHNLSLDQTSSQLMCGLTMESNGNAGKDSFVSFVKNGNTVNKYNLGSNLDNLHGNLMETAEAIVMNRPNLKSVTYTLGQDSQKDAAVLGKLQEAQKTVQEAFTMASNGSNNITVDSSFTKFLGNYVREAYHKKISRNQESAKTFNLQVQNDLGNSR